MSAIWPQKVLLHDHMDGSMPLLQILFRLHRLSGKECPFTHDNIQEQVKAWFHSDRDIVERFGATTGVMQKPETLALAAETYVEVRAKQGFEYCEMTIAPQYHVYGGLTVQEAVEALIDGIKVGEEKCGNPKMEANILFSIGREVSPDEAVRLVEIAAECDRDYVVGIGLVCDEAAHPPYKHKKMFERAHQLGFKTTCHAGEWVCGSGQNADFERDLPGLLGNIRTAVYDLEVDRIGHAIGLAEDRNLMGEVIERKIGIEGYPGSNLSSGLIPNTLCLKIREMLKAGVRYSIHPDDDLFLPDLDETFQLCNAEYDFSEPEGCQLMVNAWLSRFGNRKPHDVTS